MLCINVILYFSSGKGIVSWYMLEKNQYCSLDNIKKEVLGEMLRHSERCFTTLHTIAKGVIFIQKRQASKV